MMTHVLSSVSYDNVSSSSVTYHGKLDLVSHDPSLTENTDTRETDAFEDEMCAEHPIVLP